MYFGRPIVLLEIGRSFYRPKRYIVFNTETIKKSNKITFLLVIRI